MMNHDALTGRFPGPATERRKVRVDERSLVRMAPAGTASGAPLTIRSAGPAVELAQWAGGHRAEIRRLLSVHGALLFRGFGIGDVATFERAIDAAVGQRLAYTERSSPRTQVGSNVFTSTDYPPEYPIFLHNEQSYNVTFPLRIAFGCLQPAASGGSTPIADTRRVLARVPGPIRDRFMRGRFALVRNYGQGGVGWQDAFQTGDPAQVERHCRTHDIACEWTGPGRLRTTQVRPVVARHPDSGELAWFNHLTFFHTSTLPPAVRDHLTAGCGPGDLPSQTYHGDGTAIEPGVLDALRAAYEAETVRFEWEAGDLLLLDNMLMAHGRAPFTPPRRVVVAMAEPTNWSDVIVAPSAGV